MVEQSSQMFHSHPLRGVFTLRLVSCLPHSFAIHLLWCSLNNFLYLFYLSTYYRGLFRSLLLSSFIRFSKYSFHCGKTCFAPEFPLVELPSQPFLAGYKSFSFFLNSSLLYSSLNAFPFAFYCILVTFQIHTFASFIFCNFSSFVHSLLLDNPWNVLTPSPCYCFPFYFSQQSSHVDLSFWYIFSII